MPRGQGGLQERLNFLLPFDDSPRGQELGRHEALEEAPTFPVGFVDQRSPFQVEEVEEAELQGDLLLGRLDSMDAAEPTHEVLEREGLAVRIDRDDLAFQQEFRGGERLRDRDDLRQAVRDVAQPPGEDADRVAFAVDLDAGSVELVLDGRLAPMLAEDFVEILRHLGEHRFHGGEESKAAGAKARSSFEERDLRDEAEVAEEHVRGPDRVRFDACGVRDPLEHDSFVHADPHLPEDVPEQDVPFPLGRAAEEGLEQAATGPRRVGAASLGDLAEHVGHLEDREGPGDQGRLLRSREGLLEGRPSDVQRAGVRFREDPADDQVDGRRDLLPPQGTQERGQERALLQAFRGRLEFRREVREAGERSLFRGRRGHGESGPSEASGFNVSPAARVSVGPRKR